MADIYIITFPSVAHAFRAEKLLQSHQVAARLIPIPRSLSGCCEGLAAEIDELDLAVAVDALTKAGVEMIQTGICVRAD